MPSFDFQITRNGQLVDINCPVAQVNFNSNAISPNFHYTSPLGGPTSRTVNFDQDELLQAATDAGENAAAFLATYKAIITQASVTKFGDVI